MPSFVSQRWNVEGSAHHFSVQNVEAQLLGSDPVRCGVIWRPLRGERSSRPSLHRSTNTTQHSSFPARRDIHKGQMRWRRVDPHDSHYGVIKNLHTERVCVLFSETWCHDGLGEKHMCVFNWTQDDIPGKISIKKKSADVTVWRSTSAVTGKT